MDQLLAAVDLGSNSFRSPSDASSSKTVRPRSIRSIVSGNRPAGRRTDTEKRLGDEAIERAIAVLERFGERLRSFHPNRVRAVATNTFRVARNTRDFLPRAEAALGFPSKSSPAAKKPA